MKLTEILAAKRPTLSFEVFPPKTTDTFDSIKKATEEVASLHPDFMSVTYGAGGGVGNFTIDIASNVIRKYNVPTIAHLSCVSSSREQIDSQLEAMKREGIENVLALRGDIPEDAPAREDWSFHYASDLAAYIRERGDFCIGGACYPEGHPESANQREDIAHLKIKAEAGCDFFTTQMFFDNNIMYNFLYKVRDAGITTPVIAGIMPVVNGKQIKRICAISGMALPARFCQIVDRFGDDPNSMKQAGIAYATEQIIDLIANGVNHIHVYSMNKPDVAAKILDNLSEIVR